MTATDASAPAGAAPAVPSLLRRVRIALQRVWAYWWGKLAEDTPLRSIKPGTLLPQALDDAELLLAYAVQSSQPVDETLIGALIDAVGAIRCAQAAGQTGDKLAAAVPPPVPVDLAKPADRCTADLARQKAFWKAYDAVAQKLAPMSAYTIRKTHEYSAQPWPAMFFSSTFQLAIVSALVFLLAMFLQARWLDGKRIEDRLRTLDVAFEKQHTEFRSAFDRLCELTAAPPAAIPTATKPLTVAKTTPAAAAASPVEPLPVQQARRQLWANGHSREMIEQRQQRLLVEIDAWGRWLPPVVTESWQARMTALLTFSPEAPASASAAAPAAGPASAAPVKPAAVAPAPAPAAGPSACQSGPPLSPAIAQARAEGEAKRLTFEARLGMLETVCIPMLMGLLGASTYMLRLIVLQLRASTFTPRFPSLTVVRLVLGMIVGVLGGSLLPVIGDNGLKSLPPLAMPFVFGYAIEVLFAGLDKVVSSFTPAPVAPVAPVALAR